MSRFVIGWLLMSVIPLIFIAFAISNTLYRPSCYITPYPLNESDKAKCIKRWGDLKRCMALTGVATICEVK